MPKARQIRRAYVEYQPDLRHPVEPIPLGVLTEENTSDYRHVVIVGREPKGSVPGFDLDKLWGPFRAEITDWFEILSKNVVTAMDELPDKELLVDHLAAQWHSNVYIRAPESLELAAEGEALMTRTTRWYEAFVGEPFRKQQPRRRAPRKVVPIARVERYMPWRRLPTAASSSHATC